MERKSGAARRVLESAEELRSMVWCLRRNIRALEKEDTGRFSGIREELAEKEAQLAQREKELQQLESQLRQWIDLLPCQRWRMVLRHYYLEGMGLIEVADALSKSTGRKFTSAQIYSLHFRALEAAEKLWPLH